MTAKTRHQDYLSDSQVDELQALAQRFDFDSRSAEYLINTANLQQLTIELIQGNESKKKLLQSEDWDALVKSVKNLKAQLQAFLYERISDDDLNLKLLRKDMEAQFPGIDFEEAVSQFNLRSRLKPGFTVLPDSSTYDGPAKIEREVTFFVTEPLIDLEQALDKALIALEFRCKRGRPGDRQMFKIAN